MWMYSGYLPRGFNESLLWLLPKSSHDKDSSGAKDTRPLSGASTDAKIFAMTVADILNRKLEEWAYIWQRGSIRGRSLLQNVVDLGAFSISFSWNPEGFPGFSLLDFAAAFPSICRQFIWIALEEIGIPLQIIKAIQAHYHFNSHFVRVNGTLKFVFTARSGVRQGCPLSSIFCPGYWVHTSFTSKGTRIQGCSFSIC